MVNYPTSIDSDIELPRVDNNIVEIGADAINALREAVFAIETEVGIGGSGTQGSIATRLGVSIDNDGTIKPSALTGIGLVSLPIDNSQISGSAGIAESKLSLTHSTLSLYNSIQDLINSTQIINDFINLTGAKIAPHITGSAYRHLLSHIDVNVSPAILDRTGTARHSVNPSSLSNADDLIKNISDDLVSHEKANGLTGSGVVPPTNYAHVAQGIHIDSNAFQSISHTIDDLQKFSEFVDTSSLLLIGSRIQNFYSNGIPRTGRLSVLDADGYGELLVDTTTATTYLLNALSANPVDDIDHGDDIIELIPSSDQLADNKIDGQFTKVQSGDVIHVNYASGIQAVFLIDSVKYDFTSSTKRYLVRVNGKNLLATTSATVKISRSTYHINKWGALALSEVNMPFSSVGSLISAQPRGAVALGINFDPNNFDSTHYNLYLQFYPDGNPLNRTVTLPAIDVTGNQGITPGKYTLDSIVSSTNKALHTAGFNFRAVAFSYAGNFGIKLADPYNNAGFSIINGVLNNSGTLDSAASASTYPNNVIGDYAFSLFGNISKKDPLGFGVKGANIASPAYSLTYANSNVAQSPTKIFLPLKRNYYYVNGSEIERFKPEVSTSIDSYGDNYWPATIDSIQSFSNHVEVTYKILYNLSTSGLAIGKTLVTQPVGSVASSNSIYSNVDYGRFLIKNVAFMDCATLNPYTLITVYDGIHGVGSSPQTSSVGIAVHIYFTGDSIGFDNENVSDLGTAGPFKRYFEVVVDQSGNTFSHERARFLMDAGTIPNALKLNICRVSPKLQGQVVGQKRLTNLTISNYDNLTGSIVGSLTKDPSLPTKGPVTYGKKGEIVRFYDQSNIDFIDVTFNIDDNVAAFSNEIVKIELFPSLELDSELFFLGSAQVDDNAKKVSYVRDGRQFGNVSETQLSTSALDYISAGDRLLHENGVIRGLDNVGHSGNKYTFNGGVAIVNGKIIDINDQFIHIPVVQELDITDLTNSTIIQDTTWCICVNDKAELMALPLMTEDIRKRLYRAKDPINSSTYIIDSVSSYELITTRRDLTPIFMVSANVNNSGQFIDNSDLTLAFSGARQFGQGDARRFVNEGGYNSPLVWTNGDLIGNFKSVEALKTWVSLSNSIDNKSDRKTGNNIGNTVDMRGTINIGASDPSLFFTGFTKPIVFNGNDITIYHDGETAIEVGSNVTLKNIKFVLNRRLVNGEGTPPFDQNNLVNSQHGAIHILVNGPTNNVHIENCTFEHIGELSLLRYPFISVEFTTADIFQDFTVKNCKFISDTSSDDIRAAIAVINLMPFNQSGTSSPMLSNAIISGNICNKNQMIIVTSKKQLVSGVLKMAEPGLAANNVIIKENTCGVIGYWISSPYLEPIEGITDFYRDKESNLVIANNCCHFIGGLDSTGKIVTGMNGSVSGLRYSPGHVQIINNVCNWVRTAFVNNTGIQGNGSLLISGNTLSAFTKTFLSSYIPTSYFNTAIVIDSINTSVGNSFNTPLADGIIISNNNITAGSNYSVYYETYMFIRASATISNNICNGAAGATLLSDSKLILLDNGYRFIITGNSIFRNMIIVNSYIGVATLPSGSQGIISNNFFDYFDVDTDQSGPGTDENIVKGIPNNWIYEKNINQTVYLSIPLNSNAIALNTLTTGSGLTNTTDPLYSAQATTTSNYQKILPESTTFDIPKSATPYLAISSVVQAAEYRTIGVAINLNRYLSSGAQILEVKIGFGSASSFDTAAFDLGIAKHFNHSDTRELDVVAYALNVPNVPYQNYYAITQQTSFTSGVTNYLTLSGIDASYSINSTFDITAYCNLQFHLNTTSTSYIIYVSPIRIKYRW